MVPKMQTNNYEEKNEKLLPTFESEDKDILFSIKFIFHKSLEVSTYVHALNKAQTFHIKKHNAHRNFLSLNTAQALVSVMIFSEFSATHKSNM